MPWHLTHSSSSSSSSIVIQTPDTRQAVEKVLVVYAVWQTVRHAVTGLASRCAAIPQQEPCSHEPGEGGGEGVGGGAVTAAEWHALTGPKGGCHLAM
jgi:hypothetical protein